MFIKIVPAHQRAVVFRFGVCLGVKGPGRVFLVPVVDKVILVDVQEASARVPSQEILTRDAVSVTIGLRLTFQVVDAQAATLSLNKAPSEAVVEIATRSLRATVTSMAADEALTRPDRVGEAVRFAMNEELSTKGVKAIDIEVDQAGGSDLTPTS